MSEDKSPEKTEKKAKAPEVPELILAKNGQPFTTRNAAEQYIRVRNLPPGRHQVEEEEDGGYVIKVLPPPPPETYSRVEFQARTDTNQDEDVILSVNGETLVIQREKPVILPARFRECADHATYPIYSVIPGQGRKVKGKIKKFPYSVIDPVVSEKEYLEFKAAGDRHTKQKIKQHGYGVTPEVANAE